MSVFGCEQGKMYDALSSPDAKVFDQGHLYLVRMLQTFHPRTPFFCVPKWQHGGQNCMVGIPNIHEKKRTEMRRPCDVPTPSFATSVTQTNSICQAIGRKSAGIPLQLSSRNAAIVDDLAIVQKKFTPGRTENSPKSMLLQESMFLNRVYFASTLSPSSMHDCNKFDGSGSNNCGSCISYCSHSKGWTHGAYFSIPVISSVILSFNPFAFFILATTVGTGDSREGSEGI
jgi:hypothetical protein